MGNGVVMTGVVTGSASGGILHLVMIVNEPSPGTLGGQLVGEQTQPRLAELLPGRTYLLGRTEKD